MGAFLQYFRNSFPFQYSRVAIYITLQCSRQAIYITMTQIAEEFTFVVYNVAKFEN